MCVYIYFLYGLQTYFILLIGLKLSIFYKYWPIKFHANQPKTQSVIWFASSCHLQLYGGWDGAFIILKWTSVSQLMLFALNSSSCDMKGLVLDFFSLTFASCISAHPFYFRPFWVSVLDEWFSAITVYCNLLRSLKHIDTWSCTWI